MKKDSKGRSVIATGGALAELVAAVCFAADNFLHHDLTMGTYYLSETHTADMVIAAGELCLMLLVFSQAIKHHKYYILFLSALGTIPALYLDLTGISETSSAHLKVDHLTVIMVLIVGIVGSLICIYAVGYIRDYHHHHTEYQDRSGYFLSMLFVFLGAMMGLISSDNLSWMYFFWEITSVCSFLLIGYSKTPEAVTNSFRALWMNLLGGCGFMAAIVFCVCVMEITNISQLLLFATIPAMAVFPVAMLSFAALTKSAQMPFCRWLLGAMVAPTPTSALLHSATMVKAGVYLLLRLSPMMYGTYTGIMVTVIGGFTFFAASLLAITVSDGKKILAYSTISNLGLITAAAGCGISEAVWAGIMLLIFHAVTKSMMFMSVGAYENSTGSRDVEDMHGMIVRYPKLAFVMTIGIFGMSVVPMGMCVAKWAALKAFIDSGYVYLTLFLCFGSASTMFYWIKWLGKIFSVSRESRKHEDTVHRSEWAAIYPLTFTAMLLCLVYPIISAFVVNPYVQTAFNGSLNRLTAPGPADDLAGSGPELIAAISTEDFVIMGVMLICMCILPLGMKYVNTVQERRVLSYMSGFNTGNDRSFYDSQGEEKEQFLSNWYMNEVFGEKKLLRPCLMLTSAFLIVIMTACTIGGLFI
ncbi:MAG: NADH-quinone oxidoreductase subunit L [Lachnospiraceae bacterium]|nr:NADH-quinone oxidoreductase subunit L [Lachnospiraceae bacterium]